MTTTFLMRIQLLYSCTELYSSKITEDVRDSPKVFISLEICLPRWVYFLQVRSSVVIEVDCGKLLHAQTQTGRERERSERRV